MHIMTALAMIFALGGVAGDGCPDFCDPACPDYNPCACAPGPCNPDCPEFDLCICNQVTCVESECGPGTCDPQTGSCLYDTGPNEYCNDYDACTIDICVPFVDCYYDPVDCDDGDACTEDSCDPDVGCVHRPILCDRVDAARKGSLLVLPAFEIKWDPNFRLFQDTFLTLVNDYPGDVFVHLFFVNGDPATAPIFVDGTLVERGHPGWNNTNCTLRLTPDQPVYWSVATGLPGGCQPLGETLDPGTPVGRPDPDNLGGRMLRGFVYAWAVDSFGREISWNHLGGSALFVDYLAGAAWEYQAYAFQAHAPHGQQTDAFPGLLLMDGLEFSLAYDQLLLSYYAAGSFSFSGAGRLVQSDTDLTLMPASQDLRQDTCGPVLTKANFVIHNMNEVGFSGTERCISCWDQTLFSRYARNANYLLRANVQTDKAKARIDGVRSQVCDGFEVCGFLDGKIPFDSCAWIADCSTDAALLGVQNKRLVFAGQGPVAGVDLSGTALVGQGVQFAVIYYDIPTPPNPIQSPITSVGEVAPVESQSDGRDRLP